MNRVISPLESHTNGSESNGTQFAVADLELWIRDSIEELFLLNIWRLS